MSRSSNAMFFFARNSFVLFLSACLHAGVSKENARRARDLGVR